MIVYDHSKTCIMEMPKTGTTWLQTSLTGWRQGVTLRNVCPRHAQPADYAEGVNPAYLKVFIFRHPIEWCTSFGEFHSALTYANNSLTPGRHFAHFDVLPFGTYTQEVFWNHILQNSGKLTEYFRSYLDHADFVIPMPYIRQGMTVLQRLKRVTTLPGVDLRRCEMANVGGHTWQVGDYSVLKTYIEHNERHLMNQYQRCLNSWAIWSKAILCRT